MRFISSNLFIFNSLAHDLTGKSSISDLTYQTKARELCLNNILNGDVVEMLIWIRWQTM